MKVVDMKQEYAKLKNEFTLLFEELEKQDFFYTGQNIVIGCSTSEVIGEKIGSQSSLDVAEVLFRILEKQAKKYNVNFIFQGCEHINRALTLDKTVADGLNASIVSVVPHRSAGGSLSEYAYYHLNNPVVIESVDADAGIDIGQTLIGMHIKNVAVPVRVSVKKIGEANITIAKSRPKLIGGPRARYE